MTDLIPIFDSLQERALSDFRSQRSSYKHYRGMRIGLVGYGQVGQAVVRLGERWGVQFYIHDDRDEVLRLFDEKKRWKDQPVDACFISPGVPLKHPKIQRARTDGLALLGELEFCESIAIPTVAITGSNGKSTTTALLGALVNGGGDDYFVGGNLGYSWAQWLYEQEVKGDFGEGRSVDVPERIHTEGAILELSSFQLETAHSFSCMVAMILNISPDHGERYQSFEEYALVKKSLAARVHPEGWLLVPSDLVVQTDATRIEVAGVHDPEPRTDDALMVRDGRLIARGILSELDGCSLEHPSLLGLHNQTNAAFALAGAKLMQDSRHAEHQQNYRSFKGLAHRFEWVARHDGIDFINDSKATNDAAAATAVMSTEKPCIVLLGGRSKNGGYGLIRNALIQKQAKAICFGEAGEEIYAALNDKVDVYKTLDLQDAITSAAKMAAPGSLVLLSPACSSFDAFRNYQRRGDAFRDFVLNHLTQNSSVLTGQS